MKIARWLALTVFAVILVSDAPAGAFASPVNDHQDYPTVINSLPYSAASSTVGALDESVYPAYCPPARAGVWFKYTPTGNEPLVVSTRGSDFDTILSVYRDSPGTSGTCSDDNARLRAVVSLVGYAGHDLYIHVGGFGGATGNLRLSVNHGGTLRGALRDARSGRALAGECVSVPGGSAQSGADGTYEIVGLAAGDYRTPTVGCNASTLGAVPWSAPIRVGEGRVTNAPLLLADHATLSGVVTDAATGGPLPGVCVSAVPEGGRPWSYSARTSPTGFYAVDVAPDSYKVGFTASQACGGADYVGAYYGGAYSAAAAASVAAARGATAAGIDAQLVRGATVVGSLREASTNATISPACVRVFEAATDTPVGGVNASSTGYYRIAGLPPVPVVIQGAECNTVAGPHVSQWFADSSERAGATVVPLASGQSVTADVRLPVGGRISGAVTDDSGNGIQFPCIKAQRSDGLSFMYQPVESRYGANDTWQFTIPGLPTGSYRLLFCGQSGGSYAPEWFDDAADPTAASLINIGVTPNASASAHLSPGGIARGSVVDDASSKPSNALACFGARGESNGFSAFGGSYDRYSTGVAFYGLATGRYVIHNGCGTAEAALTTFDAVAGSEIAFPTIRIPSVDSDGDGVTDRLDNCPITPNATQADVNNDDLGNACDVLHPGTTAAPKLTVSDRTVSEGNALHNLQAHVKLSKASSGAVTVVVSTANGTAVAPGDYTAVNRTITFPAGTIDVVVSFPIKGDRTKEANEWFTLNLASPTGGAVVGRGKATVTLSNDD